jgi:ubiquinone/menaquinone biosynthesis C-methylase UbiE
VDKTANLDAAAIKTEIQEKYNRFAPWYDVAEGIPELLGLRKLRRQLLQRAHGKILEIAVGTGKNLEYYRGQSRIIALDLSPRMLDIARKRACKLNVDVSFLVMDAERLAFPDGSFDTVVDSLSLCTFPDPLIALKEMAGVCRPKGRILLLEHGRSGREWLGRFQDGRVDKHAELLGCRWNREPLDLVRQAGLSVISARRTFFGIFHMIEASPF